MKIKHNGRYIEIERDDREEWEDIRSLECVCGHSLEDHSYKYLPRTEKFIETGGCKKSNHCSQFKITGRIESVGSYSYARQ